MKRLWRLLLAVVLMPPSLIAMVDTNDNGVSDFWEKNFNEGELFSAAFDPQADPDSDGWTNAQEAAAGTNPFDANPPDGIVRPKIAHLPAVVEETGSGQQVIIPEAITLTWPTINGKLYTLLFSPDLTAESWLPIDNSFIGNGNEVTYGFEIMAADARFWRIKVEDIDSDRDGFTNAEEYLLGTNPFAMDTDGDGVSDWQESMIQGTDPLSAADHDEDGIPDDLERHLASQLLAMCPDPAAWGAKFHGLLSGDLDPEHDYTDEGMSAAELAELLIPVARAPHGTEYLVQSMIRRNSSPAAYHIFAQENKPEFNQGQYRYSIPGDWDGGYALTSKSDFTSGYLLTQIATLAWSNYSSPSLVPWSNAHARDRSEAVSGFMQQPLAHPPGIEYRGYIRQKKFRLVAARADHAGLSETYLKIISKREYAGMGLGEVLSAEAVTLSIPRGKFSSEWFEFAAPMVDGQDTIMLLVPVEFEDINDHTDDSDDVAITPWDTAQEIQRANIAWIDAHISDQDAAPRMPQLEFRVPGLPDGLTIEAKLFVEYERPYAGKQGEDTVRIPANGNFVQVNGDTWEIYSEADWQTELNERGFFGGDAKLTYQITQGGNIVVGPEEIDFAIGGENPADDRCKQYTQSRPGAPWYAYAIEKHESEAYNPRFYNQFWERSGNSSPINGGINYEFTLGDPLKVLSPGETGVGGTGLAQVTGAGGNKNNPAARKVFWNWQRNVDAFLAILADKIQIAETFMNDETPRSGPGSMPNGQRPQTAFHTRQNVPVPSRDQADVTFGDNQGERRPEDAVAIKAYNGASAHWCSWRGPAVHEWQWNYGQNNYVERVCEQVEEEEE